jgi:hypothetical protein
MVRNKLATTLSSTSLPLPFPSALVLPSSLSWWLDQNKGAKTNVIICSKQIVNPFRHAIFQVQEVLYQLPKGRTVNTVCLLSHFPLHPQHHLPAARSCSSTASPGCLSLPSTVVAWTWRWMQTKTQENLRKLFLIDNKSY